MIFYKIYAHNLNKLGLISKTYFPRKHIFQIKLNIFQLCQFWLEQEFFVVDKNHQKYIFSFELLFTNFSIT